VVAVTSMGVSVSHKSTQFIKNPLNNDLN
jgi:hypothetical protein